MHLTNALALCCPSRHHFMPAHGRLHCLAVKAQKLCCEGRPELRGSEDSPTLPGVQKRWRCEIARGCHLNGRPGYYNLCFPAQWQRKE